MIPTFRKCLNTKRENGFTIVELLISILIAGILTAIAIPAYIHQKRVAVDATVESDVRNSISMVETWINEIPLGRVKAIPSANNGGIPGIRMSSGSIAEIKGNNISYCIVVKNNAGEKSKTGVFYKTGNGSIRSTGPDCDGFTPDQHSDINGTYTVSDSPVPIPMATPTAAPAPTSTALPSASTAPTPSPSPTVTTGPTGYIYNCGAHSFTITATMLNDSKLLKIDGAGGWNTIVADSKNMTLSLNGITHNASGPAVIQIGADGSCDVNYYLNGVKTQYLKINAAGIIETHYKYEAGGIRISYKYDANGQVVQEEYNLGLGITRTIDYIAGAKHLDQWFLDGKLHKEGAPAYIKYRADGTVEESKSYILGVLQVTGKLL